MAVDLKKLYNSIIDQYDTKEKTIKFFKDYAFYFNKGKYGISNINGTTFSARKEDKTPSAHAKERLFSIDFGDSQKVKSILQFILDIENEDIKKEEDKYVMPSAYPFSVNKLAELIKVDVNKDLSNYVPTVIVHEVKPKAKAYSISYIKRQKDAVFKSKKNKIIFKDLINGLCRSCSIEEKKRAIKIFDIGLNQYYAPIENSKKTVEVNRLFIPEMSKNLEAFGSYRYNRTLEPKQLLRKNSVRVLFGLHLIPNFNKEKPIIFAEGHSDVIVNNSKRLQTITSGSATTIIGKNISELKGMTLHLFYDLDLPGVKGITGRVYEIEKFNQTALPSDKITYKIFSWSSKLIIDDDIFNMVDYENEQKDVIRNINRDEASKIALTNEYLFEKSRVSSWKIMSEEPKKKGYDWIDFHEEMKDHANYKKFINQYSY